MSELGYGEPVPGIYGTPAPGTDPDPVSRAKLQQATIDAQIARAHQPGYVPPGYRGPDAIGPTWNQTGGGNQPTPGWTAQNGKGSPFPPYDGSKIGHIPNWEVDRTPGGAGDYDQNEVFTGSFPPNRLGRAPIGDGLLQYDDTPTNPNAPTTDVGGSVDLEY
jgi:hypothetical protein